MVRKQINKILLTTNSLALGGMERSVVNLAKMLNEEGVQVKIFLISSDENCFNLPEGINVYSGKRKSKHRFFVIFSLLKFRKFTKKFNPDFVLSYSGRISSFVFLSLLGVNNNVIPFHRANPDITYDKYIRFLNKLIFPRCKALVVQTEIAKRKFYKRYGNKNIIVLPNIARQLILNVNVNREKIILNVSRFVDGKGLDTLIKIFSKLENSEWKLYIIGDGELKNKLIQLIDDLSLNNRVILKGYINDVDYYLSISSIFAFTSRSEGYPNSLLEAMCAGLACISFDCPTGPAEMLKDGVNGYLIPLDDINLYIERLEKLINDENLRNSFGNEAKKIKDINSPGFIGRKLLHELTNMK